MSILTRKINKVLGKLAKKDMNMVKGGLRDSATLLQKEAKDLAPVVSGKFRRSIRRSVRGRVKTGEAVAKVGILIGSPAWKYAGTVEQKYKIMRTLEKTKQREVNKVFKKSIDEFLKRLKIKV